MNNFNPTGKTYWKHPEELKTIKCKKYANNKDTNKDLGNYTFIASNI